ncbi:hypothetical protein FQN57_006963 [Myotisia sp. PD_48]|nr:hypothetical protein FQN57_006963 [Myotisia sp. PD_48]
MAAMKGSVLLFCFGIPVMLSRIPPQYLGSILWIAPLLIAIALVSRLMYWIVLYPKYFTRLKHLPTPLPRRLLTGNFVTFQAQELPASMVQWAKEIPNDGMIRFYHFFNDEYILLTSTEMINLVTTKNSEIFNPPQFLVKFLKAVLGIGVQPDGHNPQLRQLRRKGLFQAFSFKRMKELSPLFWEKGVEMARSMEKEAGAPDKNGFRPIEASRWAKMLALDVVGSAATGKDFGSLQDPGSLLNQNYRQLLAPLTGFRQLLRVMSRYVSPDLLRRIPTKQSRRQAAAYSYVKNFALQVFAERTRRVEQGEELEPDAISLAINTGAFEEKDRIFALMFILLTGHETTAATISWSIYALCKFPEVQSRLRAELSAAFPSIKSGDGLCIDGATLGALPYLQAFCKEIFRYYPSIQILLREALTNSTIHGTFIANGTKLAIPVSIFNRSLDVWGPDADEFNPDRWIGEANSKSGGASSSFGYATFGFGAGSCIGVALAKTELPSVVAALVLKLEFEWDGSVDDIELVYGVGTMSLKTGFTVKIKPVGE